MYEHGTAKETDGGSRLPCQGGPRDGDVGTTDLRIGDDESVALSARCRRETTETASASSRIVNLPMPNVAGLNMVGAEEAVNALHLEWVVSTLKNASP